MDESNTSDTTLEGGTPSEECGVNKINLAEENADNGYSSGEVGEKESEEHSLPNGNLPEIVITPEDSCVEEDAEAIVSSKTDEKVETSAEDNEESIELEYQASADSSCVVPSERSEDILGGEEDDEEIETDEEWEPGEDFGQPTDDETELASIMTTDSKEPEIKNEEEIVSPSTTETNENATDFSNEAKDEVDLSAVQSTQPINVAIAESSDGESKEATTSQTKIQITEEDTIPELTEAQNSEDTQDDGPSRDVMDDRNSVKNDYGLEQLESSADRTEGTKPRHEEEIPDNGSKELDSEGITDIEPKSQVPEESLGPIDTHINVPVVEVEIKQENLNEYEIDEQEMTLSNEESRTRRRSSANEVKIEMQPVTAEQNESLGEDSVDSETDAGKDDLSHLSREELEKQLLKTSRQRKAWIYISVLFAIVAIVLACTTAVFTFNYRSLQEDCGDPNV